MHASQSTSAASDSFINPLDNPGREIGVILPAFGIRDAFQIKPSWHRKPVQQLFDSSGDKKHSTFGSSTSITE